MNAGHLSGLQTRLQARSGFWFNRYNGWLDFSRGSFEVRHNRTS
jgi:hypothetical protein